MRALDEGSGKRLSRIWRGTELGTDFNWNLRSVLGPAPRLLPLVLDPAPCARQRPDLVLGPASLGLLP